MTDSIRTFIAIDLPPDAKEALATLTQTLKARGLSGVRWVNPIGIHLTLKFLGNIPPTIVPRILDALQAASQSHPPFNLSLGSPRRLSLPQQPPCPLGWTERRPDTPRPPSNIR